MNMKWTSFYSLFHLLMLVSLANTTVRCDGLCFALSLLSHLWVSAASLKGPNILCSKIYYFALLSCTMLCFTLTLTSYLLQMINFFCLFFIFTKFIDRLYNNLKIIIIIILLSSPFPMMKRFFNGHGSASFWSISSIIIWYDDKIKR